MKRISSIELLRFISALMIVVWHYQHFYLPYNFASEVNFVPGEQPFSGILKFLYEYGGRGVEIFFVISGFIFSYVYINSKNISTYKFFKRRFARLYPLHFLTLLIVLALQNYSISNFDNYFVNEINDLYHFFLNIFLISGLGFQEGPSFNGVIWSVSIEILAYIIFFIFILKISNFKILNTILLLLFFLCLYKIVWLKDQIFEFLSFDERIIYCCILFFEGVLIYFINNKINNKFYIFLLGSFLLVLSLIGNMKWLIFIPSLILIFLSFENIINDRLRPIFNFLGDLTYGMYLWHLPVEIFIMITLLKTDYSMSIFLNPLFLIFHVLIVIIISIVGYLYYEKKLRNLLR